MMPRILAGLGLLGLLATLGTGWMLQSLRNASVSIETPLATNFEVDALVLTSVSEEEVDGWVERMRGHVEAESGLLYMVRATHYDHGQAPRPGTPTLLARTVVKVHQSVDGRVADLSIRNQARYPYPFNLRWREVIRAEGAEIVGADTFGGPSSRAMEPARQAVRARELQLAPVDAMLANLEPMGPLQAGTLGERPVLALTTRWQDTLVTVVTDATTARPLRVSWLEDRPIDGDVTVSVDWPGWEGGLPTRRVWAQEGRVTRVEEITFGAAGGDPQGRAAMAGTDDSYRYGLARGQFLTTWQGYGFPQEQEPGIHDRIWQELAPGVHFVSGEFHNSMVVEMSPTELVVVEAPFSPERTAALLEDIEGRWPEATISHVVQTHWHEDHCGGLRTFIAAGVPVVAPASTANRVVQSATRGKSLLPDRQTRAQREAQIIEVSDRHILTGADHTLEILAMPDNPHAPGMLIIRVAGVDILFNADLLNPGLFPTAGLTASLQRAVIGFIDPRSLSKAGVYAASLAAFIDAQDLAVDRIVGGHGPEIAAFEELAIMASYADPEEFQAQLEEFHGH